MSDSNSDNKEFNVDAAFDRLDLFEPLLLTAHYFAPEDKNKVHARSTKDAFLFLEHGKEGEYLCMSVTNLLHGSIYGEFIGRHIQSLSTCPRTGVDMLSSWIDIESFIQIFKLFVIDDGTVLKTAIEWQNKGFEQIGLSWYEKPPEQSWEDYEESNPYRNPEQEVLQIIPGETVCSIDASGFTHTLNSVYDWAATVTNHIKEQLGTTGLLAHTRAYREQDSEWICLSIWKEDKTDRCDLVFLIGEPHDYDALEPYVPDFTEALHMIGILTKTLNLKVEIGGSNNETNKYCTPDEWRENQTNAPLRVILQSPVPH